MIPSSALCAFDALGKRRRPLLHCVGVQKEELLQRNVGDHALLASHRGRGQIEQRERFILLEAAGLRV